MFNRFRSTWLAGGGAVLLVLSITGMAAAAALVSDSTTIVVDPTEPAVGATLLTFEDLNGDGIDDDCAAPVAPDAAAAAAAFLLVDTDADGTISTTEAAHSDWVGGKNCNHGGFVRWVSHGSDDVTGVTEETEVAVSPTILTFEDLDGDGVDDDCAASPVTANPAAAAAAFLLVDTDADGTISTTEAAHSDWVGGKNCNHGGFVRWVSHNKAEEAKAAKKDQASKDALKAKPAHKVKPVHDKPAKVAKAHGPK